MVDRELVYVEICRKMRYNSDIGDTWKIRTYGCALIKFGEKRLGVL